MLLIYLRSLQRFLLVINKEFQCTLYMSMNYACKFDKRVFNKHTMALGNVNLLSVEVGLPLFKAHQGQPTP